jgi:hypothetical protein
MRFVEKAPFSALAELLLGVSDGLENVLNELNAAGVASATTVARRTVAGLATGEDPCTVYEYWRECRHERLAALKGPMNLLERIFPPNAGYRSKLLDDLYERASRRPESDRVQSRALHTAEQQMDVLPLGAPFFLAMRAECHRLLAEGASSLREQYGIPEHASITRAALVDLYSTFLGEIPVTKDEFRGIAVFSRIAPGSPYRLSLVDDSRLDGCVIDSLDVSYVITDASSKLSPRHLQHAKLASFTPNDLLPYFRYSITFHSQSFAEFASAVFAVAMLTKKLFERFNAAELGMGDEV